MVIKDENRGAYFFLRVDVVPEFMVFNNSQEHINNKLDLILSSMKASYETYHFKKDRSFVCLFKSDIRKRKGELDKYIHKEFFKEGEKIIESYQTFPLRKKEFQEYINDIRKEKDFEIVSEPIIKETYQGEDVEIFSNKRNWHPWQKEIYNELFEPSGKIQRADPRKINFIYDPIGASGKSSFLKWIYANNPELSAKVSFGNASQLRSALISMGETKRLYFIDLPRSKEKNARNSDLLNVIDDLKNGFLTSPRYGRDNALVIEPPHIVIISPYIFERTGLSLDRWVIRQITKEKTLLNITKQIIGTEALTNSEKK